MDLISLPLNELFGSLATLYILALITGLNAKFRRTAYYTTLTITCLALMPLLYGIGIYFLIKPKV